MSRIVGLWCANTTCPYEQHRLQLKEMATWQQHPSHVLQSLFVVTQRSDGGCWRAHSSLPAPTPAAVAAEPARWSLVYDGVLYNAPQLRAELSATSPRSCPSTEAELITQAFAAWGEASVRRFQGMFAFALYDHQQASLSLVRDPLGIKPLYYTVQAGHVWFASELPTLLRTLAPMRLNRRAVLEWMLHRHLAADETLLEEISMVRPGHIVKIQGGRVEDHTYTFPTDYVDPATYERFRTTPEALVIEEVEETLTQSVMECLSGAAGVGTFCSGGVDSSLVTALVARALNELFAFHASASDYQRFDERHYAEAVTSALGVRLICCPVDRQTFQRALPRVITLNGMPLAHIHLIPFWLIAQRAQAHGIQVLLTGDAADDHFGGLWYRHRRQRWLLFAARIFGRLPRRVRNALALAADLHGGMPFHLVGSEGLLPHVLSAVDGYSRTETHHRFAHAYAFVSEREGRAALVTMAEDLMERWDLDRADRLGMAAGVECRAPFMHPAVVQLALNLPLPYRFRRGTDKWVLKAIAARYVPRPLVYGKKRPWDLPWSDYLAPLAQQALFRGGFCSEALGLSAIALRECITAWDTNVEVFWNLLNLELWGRLFVMGEAPDRLEAHIAALVGW